MKKFIITFAVIIIILILPFAAFGNIGVGVGTGKILVDEPLKPGLIHTIPSLIVVNTGDEPADYSVSIDYRGNQPELKPNKEWFSFEPLQFALEPGQSQIVQIKLTLPIKTNPGDYFAYLEAYPIKKTIASGGATIGVVAAAKLYFTVAPANIWQGIAYRISSFLRMYSPWSWVVLALIAAAAIIIVLKTIFKKFLKIQIKIKRK